MLIVNMQASATGYHDMEDQPWRTEVWQDGYARVPEELRAEIVGCGGYCDLETVDAVVTRVIPKGAPPKPQTALDLIEELRQEVAELRAELAAVAEG